MKKQSQLPTACVSVQPNHKFNDNKFSLFFQSRQTHNHNTPEELLTNTIFVFKQTRTRHTTSDDNILMVH